MCLWIIVLIWFGEKFKDRKAPASNASSQSGWLNEYGGNSIKHCYGVISYTLIKAIQTTSSLVGQKCYTLT